MQKKSQDSKIATDLKCGDSNADSNSQGKNANSTSEHALDNGNVTIEEQDHDSYSKNSSVSENRKKWQESKNTSEDDAASKDANENGKKFMVLKLHPKMTLPLKKTHRMLFREN